MANILRGVLTAAGLKLTLPTLGMSYVGIGISGTWTGTANFFFSNDGINFAPNPLAVTPFPSGTNVTTVTANGTWYASVRNYAAVQVALPTLQTGSPTVIVAASLDASFQNAFLTPTVQYPNSTATDAVNTLTQAARANAAWRLRTLQISVSATPTWATNPVVQIKDGTTVLWAFDLPSTAGLYPISLPPSSDTPGVEDGGLVNTPGNAMSVVVASGGSAVITDVCAEFSAA